VITFGAEQLEVLKSNRQTNVDSLFEEEDYDTTERSDFEKLKQSYFSWFYFFVNIGSIVAFTGNTINKINSIRVKISRGNKIIRLLVLEGIRLINLTILF
jgi:hypothetical protein